MSNMVYFLTGIAVSVILFFILWQYKCFRQKKRLMMLTSYLEAASCGHETVLVRIEDEFSLLEDEMYKTVSELRIAREDAQRERKQQAENLADISHQLKTPLTSMSLMTQLLSSDASSEQQEYIRCIDNQLTRLNWLTGSLLTMSRLDAGAIHFAPASITLDELAARAVEPLEQLLQERSQQIFLNGREISLSCDPYWTAEALVNIIKNCSEHIGECGNITLTASSTPLYLQITIEDNGSGFDPAEIPYLFRRFFRGKKSSSNSIGIGLALCRAIIEGQGGMIRAENRTEGGARFCIRFYS